MTENSRTFAFGTLEVNSDTWLLIAAGGDVILLDLWPFDPSPLEHKTVSVIGKMGMPPSAPTILKLTVEKLVSHYDIAIRAFDVFKSGAGGSQDAHWFQAERELLGLSIDNQHPAAL